MPPQIKVTAAQYAAERKLRGTQTEVAAKLGITQPNLSNREKGKFAISTEAWLSLLSLPKKRKAAK